MPTNDFIGFASAGSANIMSQADYAAAAEQGNGVQPGMASSKLANKVWRQGANMAAAIGDLMNEQGYDALDDGDISKLTKNLSMAVALAIEYNTTYDFKSGSICRYNGDLYIALIDNGPSSAVKAPTDTAVWAKVILTTATQSAAGYMSSADKTKLDGLISTDATPSAAGYMSSTDKTKLNGIATGAEVNQNAFSNVKVGSSTIQSDEKTDTLELAAGDAITLTADTTNDKVTIKVTDNTYAPIPIRSSGVGQVVSWSGVPSYTLPSGGTWLVIADAHSRDSDLCTLQYHGLYSGGDTITGGSVLTSGLAWRIA